jgi:preprotein translocase subunit SecE
VEAHAKVVQKASIEACESNPEALCSVSQRGARADRVRVPIAHEHFLMAERTNPFTFLQQVRAEAAKVVWPSRRETAISTVMVLVMAILASIFFLVADQIMSFGVSYLLGIGS